MTELRHCELLSYIDQMGDSVKSALLLVNIRSENFPDDCEFIGFQRVVGALRVPLHDCQIVVGFGRESTLSQPSSLPGLISTAEHTALESAGVRSGRWAVPSDLPLVVRATRHGRGAAA